MTEENILDLVNRVRNRAREKPQIKVSKAFVHHFDAVAKFYGCGLQEIDDMKAAARNDLESAQVTFETLFNEIQAGHT